MAKYFFILNNNANRGSSKKKFDELCKILSEQKNSVVVFTQHQLHATELCKQAIQQGFTHVIACGGDGTTHEVINGILSFKKEERPKLGVIPLGSGNDFAFGLSLLNPLQASLDAVFGDIALTVDAAEIKALDNSGGIVKQEFWNNTVGIGFDANVTIQSRKIKKLRGLLIYLFAVLKTIVSHFNFFKAKILLHQEAYFSEEHNSQNSFEEDFFMLTLGNGKREGGGFLTTPTSKMCDGVLEYMIVPKLSRSAVLGLIPKVMKGTHITTGAAKFGTFTSTQIISESPMPIHIDGEIFAYKEDNIKNIIISILPDAIEVLGARK